MSSNRFFIEKDGYFKRDGKHIRKWAIIQYATKNVCGYNKKLKFSGFTEPVIAGKFITKYLDPEYFFLSEKWRINY